MHIRILGAAGSRCAAVGTTCLQIGEEILIDAGHVVALPVERWGSIHTVLLTHSHFDHLLDLPFLVSCSWQQRHKPLRIYGHPATLKAVQEHLFNGVLWMDVRTLRLPDGEEPAVVFVPVEAGRHLHIDSYTIVPVRSNHPVPTLGYLVKCDGKGVVFTSDTKQNPVLWQMVNWDEEIKVVITEVSLPNRLREVAERVGHYTAQSLREDLQQLQRSDVTVYVLHWKPEFRDEVMAEIAQELPEVQVLSGGEVISL